MAIVSQAPLTIAITVVFRDTITKAKAVSVGLLMYSRTGGLLPTVARKKLHCPPKKKRWLFVPNSVRSLWIKLNECTSTTQMNQYTDESTCTCHLKNQREQVIV